MRYENILVTLVTLSLLTSVFLVLDRQALAIEVMAPEETQFDFDIIYVNDIDVILPEDGGITLVSNSYGLVVNTGIEPITKDDLDTATISISSDCENASISIGFNTDNQFTSIEPSQAWGSINESNMFLIDFLQEEEELVNKSPSQTFYIMINREDFIGEAIFNISIKIRNNTAYLQTKINFTDGQHDFVLNSGERVNSNSPAAPEVEVKVKRGLNRKVTVSIVNNGEADAVNVKYNITVKGGVANFIDKTAEDIIPLLGAGNETSVDISVFGLGIIHINATAGSANEKVMGIVFAKFVYIPRLLNGIL